jgi:molybdenum cofactor biosynthesis protein A
MSIIDNHGRSVTYLRLAVTDRCNLRCFYCMPEEGISFAEKSALLSFEEMLRLARLLKEQGVNKVRITGGEPFLRKDLMAFLRQLAGIGFDKISITTNGTLIMRHLYELEALGIRSVNYSLDTLDPARFLEITRRDVFAEVWGGLMELVRRDFEVKVNMVVMEGRNDMDILPMARLAAEYPVDVRYIEEMPFNGDSHYQGIRWTHAAILETIQREYPDVRPQPFVPGSTSFLYTIPEFKGNIGIIPAYTRSFCGTCNRLRITPTGMLKTCLYDQGVFDLRTILRAGASDAQVTEAILDACRHRARDGWEAEKQRPGMPLGFESMATIGG